MWVWECFQPDFAYPLPVKRILRRHTVQHGQLKAAIDVVLKALYAASRYRRGHAVRHKLQSYWVYDKINPHKALVCQVGCFWISDNWW